MRITPSQVGKMVVAYTFSTATALASHHSPSPSPSILPCEDIHGNCEAWHRCTVDNQSCIWGIAASAVIVAGVVVYAVGCGIKRGYDRYAKAHNYDVVNTDPERSSIASEQSLIATGRPLRLLSATTADAPSYQSVDKTREKLDAQENQTSKL